ncbi:MAG: TolC family protein [Muribaculaceae bacterium]|nr:TolC family protein [Muribaculaceae bacterium]
MKQLFNCVAILLCSSTVMAGEWTFSDCVDYAREHNISLLKSRLTEQTADANLLESKGQWQPSLDFATTHGFVNTPWGNDPKNAYNSSYGLNAGWTVWNGGQRENTIKQNKLQIEIARLNSGAVMRTLETDLLQVYLNILYAGESIGIYEEASRLSEAQAARAERLMESGKLSRVDYAQLKSQAEQDKYALVNAQGTYRNRLMELKQILELGIDAEVAPAPVNWDSTAVMAPLPPIAESYDLALQTDLQIRGLQAQASSSELDETIARAGRMPNLRLNAGVGTGYNAPGDAFGTSMKRGLNESVGLTLSVPILDNRKTKAAIARAKVAQLDASLDIEKRRTELAQIVENWYVDTEAARSRYVAAESQLEAARLADELANEKFAVGYVNPIELLTAHNSLTEAQHTLLQAKFMAMLGQKMIEFYRTATVNI